MYLSGKTGGHRNTATVLGIPRHSLENWIRKYRKDPESLKTDGRQLGKKDGIQRGRPKQIDLETLSKDEQIEYLKMENTVLKKLKALRKQNGEH